MSPLQESASSPVEEPQLPLVIPVLAETATIVREVVETGRVRLTKTVEEQEEVVPVDLRHDEVRVERMVINQFLPDDAPAPETRYEGDTMIVPVLREVLVKRLLLVEELHVSRHQLTTTEPQHVRLRQEQLTIEHLPPVPTITPNHPPVSRP
ncbi:MAG: YsnF/AvaK domain-containing protein [Janthinobacterium lividum]